jgi:deoxyuridine 5'-triphosphate nucleotidohydrolase
MNTGRSTQQPPCYLIAPAAEAEGLYADTAYGNGRGDSGVDLRFPANCTIPSSAEDNGGLATVIDLKVRVRCLSWGAYVPYIITPRSSLGSKTPLSLANSIGIVDQGYTGNLKVAVRNHSKDPFTVCRGESLFQLVLPGLMPAAVRVVQPDDAAFAAGASARGDGGFGSTGAAGSGARPSYFAEQLSEAARVLAGATPSQPLPQATEPVSIRTIRMSCEPGEAPPQAPKSE